MFKQIMFVLVAIFAITFASENTITESSPTLLTIPQLLNYQGKLTETNGNPVRDSTYSITFRFFSVPSGGNDFWTEAQSVQTHAGLFNTLLGSITPITSIPSDGNCYLEMQVLPNPAMTPRIRIVSSAYAFIAKKADSANYAPITRPITPPITNVEITDNAINSAKISDSSITRQDVIRTFKAPYSDTADFARGMNIQYVDSARIATNAYRLQGNDLTALDSRYVNEGQSNSINTGMINDNAVNSLKIADSAITRQDVIRTFKAPYSDTSDFARGVNVQYVDSARVAANAHNAYLLQGKDTVALDIRFVNENQTNAISSAMIRDSSVTSQKILDGTIQTIDLSFSPVTRPITPGVNTAEIIDTAVTTNKIKDGAITNTKIASNAVTTDKIFNNTITRSDVAANFKAPYSDTADYARAVTILFVDSTRIAANAHKLQGKDTTALSTKFVDEGQTNAITNSMIQNDAVTSGKISDGTVTRNDVANNFKAPYSDTSDYARVAPTTRPISPPITNTEISDNAVNSAKIADGTIARTDVTVNFKAPYADTADYARAVNVLFVDSARIATNAHKLQGKDTTALSAKFVDEGQVNSISNPMIMDNAVTSGKILDGTIVRADAAINFKSPYSDTADFARAVNVQYVDSARIATNAYQLQGNDMTALDNRYVNEGQNNAISSAMITNNAVTMNKIDQAGATTGQVLKWTGSAWAPSADSAGGPPSGPAGGDLTGTYPSPTIANNVVNSAKILDGSITGNDINTPITLQDTVSWPGAVLHVRNSGTGRGISIDSAGFVGLRVHYAFTDGVNIERADQSGVSIDTAGGAGLRILSTGSDGVGIDNTGWDGVYILSAGMNALEAAEVVDNGMYITHAGANGVKIDSADNYGVYAYGNLAGGNFAASNANALGLAVHSYGDASTDTAMQVYGKGYATGGFFTNGLEEDKSAPCLISPVMGILDAGTGTLQNGQAEINFDPLFTENIRTDIPIRITVTPKGKPAGFLYVTESKTTGFKVDMEVIPGLEKNSSDVTFDWIAFGTLKEYKTSPQAQSQWQKMMQQRELEQQQAKTRNEQRAQMNKYKK